MLKGGPSFTIYRSASTQVCVVSHKFMSMSCRYYLFLPKIHPLCLHGHHFIGVSLSFFCFFLSWHFVFIGCFRFVVLLFLFVSFLHVLLPFGMTATGAHTCSIVEYCGHTPQHVTFSPVCPFLCLFICLFFCLSICPLVCMCIH